MVRTVLTILLLGGTCARTCAADPIQVTSEAAPPPFRYLFVLDTSSAMSRQKEAAIDTIHKLILSGLGGRIQPGDALGIWTFSAELQTDGFPTEVWLPENRELIANRAYRWLRELRFSKKGDLSKVIPAVRQAAAISGTLTTFLVTDGSKPLVGTRFDAAVNSVFQQHAEGMRKAKKPFVLAFVAVDGQLAAHGLSPAGTRIYVPNLAPPGRTNALAKATKNGPDSPPPSSNPPPPTVDAPAPRPPESPAPAITLKQDPEPETPPAKVLSVDEIAAMLKKSDLERAQKAALTNPPAIATPQPTAEVPPPDPTPSVVPPEPAAAGRDTVAAQALESVTAQQPSVRNPPPSSKVPLPAPEPTTPLEPSTQSPARPDGASTSPTPVAVTPLAVTSQGGLSNDAKLYLVLAIVFLLVASVFGYFLFRRPRSAVGPSLISRMMEQEKDGK